jgi:hypothetical protein
MPDGLLRGDVRGGRLDQQPLERDDGRQRPRDLPLALLQDVATYVSLAAFTGTPGDPTYGLCRWPSQEPTFVSDTYHRSPRSAHHPPDCKRPAPRVLRLVR